MIIDKCILCNIPSIDLGVKKVEGLNIKRTEYTIAQCPSCKLFWTKDPSDDYNKLYEGDYWHEHMKEIGGWQVEDQARIDNDLKWAEIRKPDIQKWFPTPGKLLEIGCSTGSMLKLCQSLRHEVVGVEPDNAAATVAIKLIDHPYTCVFKSMDQIKNTYDYLLALDVIEHVINPKWEAATWIEKVKVGGTIWIECPDAGCEDAIANNRGPVPELEFGYLMPFEHIYQFNQNNLIRMFESLGCVCVWSGNVFTTDRQRCIFKKVW